MAVDWQFQKHYGQRLEGSGSRRLQLNDYLAKVQFKSKMLGPNRFSNFFHEQCRVRQSRRQSDVGCCIRGHSVKVRSPEICSRTSRHRTLLETPAYTVPAAWECRHPWAENMAPNSPDLNSTDCVIWGQAGPSLPRKKFDTVDQLKQVVGEYYHSVSSITASLIETLPAVCCRQWRNFNFCPPPCRNHHMPPPAPATS